MKSSSPPTRMSLPGVSKTSPTSMSSVAVHDFRSCRCNGVHARRDVDFIHGLIYCTAASFGIHAHPNEKVPAECMFHGSDGHQHFATRASRKVIRRFSTLGR